MPSLDDVDILSLLLNGSTDKVISDFDGNTTLHTVAAATLSGGFYLPKTDSLRIPNPAGKRGLMTMIYTTDDQNYYPQRPKIFQPGNPPLTGRPIATAGAIVSDEWIDFYFVHYSGSPVDYKMFWVIDNIL